MEQTAGIIKFTLGCFIALMFACLILFFCTFCEELATKKIQNEILEIQKKEEISKLNYYKILEEVYRRQLK